MVGRETLVSLAEALVTRVTQEAILGTLAKAGETLVIQVTQEATLETRETTPVKVKAVETLVIQAATLETLAATQAQAPRRKGATLRP